MDLFTTFDGVMLDISCVAFVGSLVAFAGHEVFSGQARLDRDKSSLRAVATILVFTLATIIPFAFSIVGYDTIQESARFGYNSLFIGTVASVVVCFFVCKVSKKQKAEG